MNCSYSTEKYRDIKWLGEIEGLRVIFSDYKIVQYKELPVTNQLYISGVGEEIENRKVLFNDSKLLLAVVALGKKIQDKQAWNCNKHELWPEYIKLCEKYGLAWIPITTFGISLNNFTRQAYELYCLFETWQSIINNDKERILKISNCLGYHFVEKDVKNSNIATINEFLAYKLSLGTLMGEKAAAIAMKYYQKTDKFKLNIYAEDLFSVARLQLALLFQTNKKDSKGIRHCSLCGEPFEIEHNNRKMCDRCRKFDYHRIFVKNKRKINPNYGR